MKEIKIENITLGLSSEGMNVRVKSNKENLVLSNQNIDNVAELIEHNFNIVSNHYKLIIDREKKEFDLKDINFISISIVLHYLYMYNSWRVMYKKQENKDLRFNENDFSNPSTHDIVFNYFKTKYPNDWEEKCAVLLGIELNKLNTYYKIRERFYNK
ncbi:MULTISPECIES: hypothetical protein [unclassified Sphingobacterium]|uniref:hypothetical protein n=1 Tax=unclassified Sphingobacterium TaxID=2609468 RepID=UPI0025ED9C89|nr:MULTISPECIES: hypothetical protein [unclassified Sphingobacterium]